MTDAGSAAGQDAFQSANDAFYLAFSGGNSAAMRELWARDLPVFCCHPGWPPILTREEILASWDEIFSHGTERDIAFIPQQSAQIGDLGIVCGVEVLGSGQFACTNIFVRQGGEWRMLHHHAGPLAPGAFPHIATPSDPGRNIRH